jgi:hypothetical protein
MQDFKNFLRLFKKSLPKNFLELGGKAAFLAGFF